MSTSPSQRQTVRAPIPYARQSIDESDVEAVVAALRSEFVTQGPRVERFEAALAEITGSRYAVAVSSGTAALHVACAALGLGPGDVGICPSITFAATANCLRYCGAEVTFCDVDRRSGLSDVGSFTEALPQAEKRGRLRVVLPVSFAGRVAELPSVAAWAEKQGAFVIEDAAHSLGGYAVDDQGKEYRSASCRYSDAAILSFHPVKHICSAEGGALLTNDAALAARARRLRSHGIERGADWRYAQTELGFHYRMNELQAALGISQLGKLPRFLERRKSLAATYTAELAKPPFLGRIELPETAPGAAWHLYIVRFVNPAEREVVYRLLHLRGIRVQVHYIPLYQHGYYSECGHEALEGAEAFYESCLSLPLFPALTDEEQAYVIDTLRSYFSGEAG